MIYFVQKGGYRVMVKRKKIKINSLYIKVDKIGALATYKISPQKLKKKKKN